MYSDQQDLPQSQFEIVFLTRQVCLGQNQDLETENIFFFQKNMVLNKNCTLWLHADYPFFFSRKVVFAVDKRSLAS